MLKNITPTTPKLEVLTQVRQVIKDHGFTIKDTMEEKPWGAGYRFAETDLSEFLSHYFPDLEPESLNSNHQHSPKFLLIAPNARLSWQYHHRRSEIWRCIDGPVGVITSDTDQQKPLQELQSGETIHITQGQRHRIVGLNNWATIAEIWQHTDPDHPSNEKDIVRLQDDYHRT